MVSNIPEEKLHSIGQDVLCPSVLSDLVTPWTVAHRAPLSMGTLQTGMLEWVAMPFSRGPS